jgi:DNA modification methylase
VLNSILLGDCLDILPTLAADSVDCVVTDPPYGLGTKEPTLDEILAYLNGSELDTGGDFMGRDWSIPPVAVWKECLRVLKPGGHLLSFGGTRTFDLISLGLRAAGFDHRDTVATQFGTVCLQWVYGQGFPKSLNIAKALEKAGAPPEVVEKWRGWGTALKPSWEPILVFRKPIETSTVIDQVALSGTGAINIDALRVGSGSGGVREGEASQDRRYTTAGGTNYAMKPGPRGGDAKGRWPANFLLVHSEGCKVVGSRSVPAPVINRFDDGMKPFGDGVGHPYTSEQTGDADGLEEIPVYECEDGCPVKLLDQQSGELKSGAMHPEQLRVKSKGDGGYGGGMPSTATESGYVGDQGGASRFFGQFQPEAPFCYTAKVSKSERNRGVTSKHFRKGFVVVREDLSENDVTDLLATWPGGSAHPFAFGPGGERIQFEKNEVPTNLLGFFEDVLPDTNLHPTVKPVALMEWLVKLVSPKGATVLDPYCGSGTTCIAALNADCSYVGIERDPASHETATKRIAGLAVEIDKRRAERQQQANLLLMEELAEGNG